MLIFSLFIPLFQKIFHFGKLLFPLWIHCIWCVKPLLAEKNWNISEIVSNSSPVLKKERNAVLFSCRIQAQNMTTEGSRPMRYQYLSHCFCKGILITLFWYCYCKHCSLLWPLMHGENIYLRIFDHSERFVKNWNLFNISSSEHVQRC